MTNLPAELLPCPSCHEIMVAFCVDALPLGHQTLDYCESCRGIWFDLHESTRLAPAGILVLFRIIRDAQMSDVRSIESSLSCPRCRQVLVATRDRVRSGPFAYDRCPKGHGRFTSFAQFMTEKGFVRHLAKKEIEKIAVRINQINCHSCGAPIDLRGDTACSHCRAPIAVLDAEAMAKAFESYVHEAAPRIREVSGNLTMPTPRPKGRPVLQSNGASLLELGVVAVLDLFG